MKYPNRLRVLRAERRINQQDTAIKSRLSFFRYWRIEAGYVKATPREKKRIAKVLKSTVEQAWPESEAVAS